MSADATYRSCASAYVVLCGPWVALGVVALLDWASFETGAWREVALFIGIAAVVAVWLRWFRLVISDVGFSSRSPFGRTRSVPYSHVQSVKMSVRGPATKVPLGVIVTLSDGDAFRVNFKVFPKLAGDLLMERIRGEA